jgi:hypothetical protein
MRVLIDDRESGIQVATVGDAIRQGADLVEGRGRLIVEVFVDGTRLGADELDAPDTVSRGATEVSLASADRRELVAGAFRDGAESLVRADELQQDAAERVQADDPVGALERLGEALEIWSAVQQAVRLGAQTAAIDLDTVQLTDRSACDAIAQLNEQLQVVRDALQAGDPVGLSDTLLYELPQVVHVWRELLHRLERLVTTQGTEGD